MPFGIRRSSKAEDPVVSLKEEIGKYAQSCSDQLARIEKDSDKLLQGAGLNANAKLEQLEQQRRVIFALLAGHQAMEARATALIDQDKTDFQRTKLRALTARVASEIEAAQAQLLVKVNFVRNQLQFEELSELTADFAITTRALPVPEDPAFVAERAALHTEAKAFEQLTKHGAELGGLFSMVCAVAPLETASPVDLASFQQLYRLAIQAAIEYGRQLTHRPYVEITEAADHLLPAHAPLADQLRGLHTRLTGNTQGKTVLPAIKLKTGAPALTTEQPTSVATRVTFPENVEPKQAPLSPRRERVVSPVASPEPSKAKAPSPVQQTPAPLPEATPAPTLPVKQVAKPIAAPVPTVAQQTVQPAAAPPPPPPAPVAAPPAPPMGPAAPGAGGLFKPAVPKPAKINKTYIIQCATLAAQQKTQIKEGKLVVLQIKHAKEGLAKRTWYLHIANKDRSDISIKKIVHGAVINLEQAATNIIAKLNALYPDGDSKPVTIKPEKTADLAKITSLFDGSISAASVGIKVQQFAGAIEQHTLDAASREAWLSKHPDAAKALTEIHKKRQGVNDEADAAAAADQDDAISDDESDVESTSGLAP